MSVFSSRLVAPLAALALVAVFLLSLAISKHATATRAVQAGEAFPDIEVEALDGTTGPLTIPPKGTVLVNVFATWCGPCMQELPGLSYEAVRLAKHGVRTIGIDQGENTTTLGAFRQRHLLPFPVVADPASRTRRQLGARIIPETLVVRDGVVAAIYEGPLSAHDFEAIAHVQ
jgi:cytochrome c biogenesis protein CcmG, thiol:disulfide interchange protein DsbE